MKPTPFEVFNVAAKLHCQQEGHRGNWKGLEYFIPAAIHLLADIAKQLDASTVQQIDEVFGEHPCPPRPLLRCQPPDGYRLMRSEEVVNGDVGDLVLDAVSGNWSVTMHSSLMLITAAKAIGNGQTCAAFARKI